MGDRTNWMAASEPDAPGQYVNNAGIAMSQWDLTIDFQQSTPMVVEGTIQVTPQRVVRVMMSPTHAKALAKILMDSVATWEATYGVLPPVDTLMPPHSDIGTDNEQADDQGDAADSPELPGGSE